MPKYVQVCGCKKSGSFGGVTPHVSNQKAEFYSVYFGEPDDFEWVIDCPNRTAAFELAGVIMRMHVAKLDDKTFDDVVAPVKSTYKPDLLVAAYIGIGVNAALGLAPKYWEPSKGQIDFIENILQHAWLLDGVYTWFAENSEHPTVYLYSVVEPWAMRFASSIIRGNKDNAEELLAAIMLDEHYDETELGQAFEFAKQEAHKSR